MESYTLSSFVSGFFPLKITSVRFLHVVLFIFFSFLNIDVHWMNKFVYPFYCRGHLFGLFLFWAIVNKITMNVSVQFFNGPMFSFLSDTS